MLLKSQTLRSGDDGCAMTIVPSTSPRFRLGYVPALDGLRGIGIVLVLGYHAGFYNVLPGAFISIDMFFVLSGFLITCLLLEEWHRTGTISFRAFYARRALRLMPALVLVLVAVCIYEAFFDSSGSPPEVYKQVVATALYVNNWLEAFNEFGFPFLLPHTWSLSIEEQFYFIWPLLLFAMLRVRVPRWAVLGLLGAGIMASAVTMAALWEPTQRNAAGGPAALFRVYYGTDTRAQTILVGVVLALLADRGLIAKAQRAGRIVTVAAMALLGGLAAFVVTASREWDLLYRGGYLAVAIAVAVILVEVVRDPVGRISKFVSPRPARWLGEISYGLYLWHWPIFNVILEHTGSWPLGARAALQFAVALIVATLTYYLLEQPMLKRKGAFRTTGSGRIEPGERLHRTDRSAQPALL